jgi:hypothetical protein
VPPHCFAVDQRGNTETVHSSLAAKVDTQAPMTTDDVRAGAQTRPVAVTLSATDNPTSAGDHAGVSAIHYEIGTDPGAPTTASAVYDPNHKPVLHDGEKIRYFAVDAVGNAETAKTSHAAEVMVRTSRRRLTIHLRTRYHGRAVRRMRATINGRASKVTRTRRGYRVRVDLRGHGCTPVSVRIKATLADGRTHRLTRAYRTCVPTR